MSWFRQLSKDHVLRNRQSFLSMWFYRMQAKLLIYITCHLGACWYPAQGSSLCIVNTTHTVTTPQKTRSTLLHYFTMMLLFFNSDRFLWWKQYEWVILMECSFLLCSGFVLLLLLYTLIPWHIINIHFCAFVKTTNKKPKQTEDTDISLNNTQHSSQEQHWSWTSTTKNMIMNAHCSELNLMVWQV